MDLLSIILVALSLSADCFAVAISSSIAGRTFSRLQVLRVAFAFGLLPVSPLALPI